MRKTRWKVMIVFILVMLIFVVSCTKKEFDDIDNGISYTLQSENPKGKINELHSILEKKTEITESAKVEEFDMEICKDRDDTIIYSTLHSNSTKIDINYFDSANQGAIHTEESTNKDDKEYLTWGQLMFIMDAIDINRVADYEADLIEIQYPFEPLNISEITFTAEDKKQTYDYTNIAQAKPKEDSNGILGFYLYKDDTCIPIENMSSMDGTYYCIKVSFLDSNNKETTYSYHGRSWFGVLVEK